MELILGALKDDPQNGSYLDSLGWVYFKKGDFLKAEKYIREALIILPNDPTINEHLGDIYFKLANVEKAILQWEKSLIYNPNNKEVQKKLLKKVKL